jgi:hypothetical protein
MRIVAVDRIDYVCPLACLSAAQHCGQTEFTQVQINRIIGMRLSGVRERFVVAGRLWVGANTRPAETLCLRFAWGNFLARSGLPPKQQGFFESRGLEENADGNNIKVLSAPAASNLPRHFIHPRDCSMAAVACAQYHFDRTIDDSGGHPC